MRKKIEVKVMTLEIQNDESKNVKVFLKVHKIYFVITCPDKKNEFHP